METTLITVDIYGLLEYTPLYEKDTKKTKTVQWRLLPKTLKVVEKTNVTVSV